MYVTDHKPLLTGREGGRVRNIKGSNSDLWLRIRSALDSRGPGSVSVVWAASHLDEDDPSPSSWQQFLVAGNRHADEAAVEAAGRSWTLSLVSEPATDQWDATAALVRRRARIAPAETAAAAPKKDEDPSGNAPAVERARRGTQLEIAARSSSHLFEPVGSSFRCRKCGALSTKDKLLTV